MCVVYVERGKLLQAQTCLERTHKLAPGEDYVVRHLQIVKNRIAKLKINPNEKQIEETAFSSSQDNRVISNKSNKSIEETERTTQPVVSQDSDKQRYSSHVVNTEPVFVKNIDNINYVENAIAERPREEFDDEEASQSAGKKLPRQMHAPAYNVGTDGDDPSSGMS